MIYPRGVLPVVALMGGRGGPLERGTFFRLHVYTLFSHDVTAAILASLNNETAAMLVSQTNPVGDELLCKRFLLFQ